MSFITVGVIDYGVGNHASVVNSLKRLGFRLRVSADPGTLDQADILLLPGVGAFPVAMFALKEKGLDQYLISAKAKGKPIIGICLGMQLLTSGSQEFGYTKGLDLIPGEIVPFKDSKWHIGWNAIATDPSNVLFGKSNGREFYFNHSYYYQGPEKYHAAQALEKETFVCAIKKDKVVGIQFHPEKSQFAGLEFLETLITELTHG
jgi:glutamine amidotransferase